MQSLAGGVGIAAPTLTGSSGTSAASALPSSAAGTGDVLMSRIVTGEFVLLDQLANNYSQLTQKSLLAERIVQLLDQVFLSSDVRRFYSRTEVTNISRNFARENSLLIECNILLSESISYAAQMFGLALYESLSRTNDKLANQSSYSVDKNTIKFNTIPDKDLRMGLVPAGVLAPQIRKEIGIGAPPGKFDANQSVNNNQKQTASEANNNSTNVVWSDWSQWSSCFDKNGQCDSSRLHSRIRKCVVQSTGELLDNGQCKLKFGSQDKELEVTDCTSSCEQHSSSGSSGMSQSANVGASDRDAIAGPNSPLGIVNPQTAPPGLVGPANDDMALQFGNFNSAPHTGRPNQSTSGQSAPTDNYKGNNSGQQAPSPSTSSNKVKQIENEASNTMSTDNNNDFRQKSATNALVAVQKLPESSFVNQGPNSGLAVDGQVIASPSSNSQNLTCTNCSHEEICLIQLGESMPGCVKIKDFNDPRGCGGWCLASNQLCLQSGPSAHRCIHESECLPDEWRCHNSACIPLSKRCDGHFNCYDNSDERGCPANSGV